MDILAHGLWTYAAARAANRRAERSQGAPSGRPLVNARWMTFWGVAPDLFAFTPLFTALIIGRITGVIHIGDWPNIADDSALASVSRFTANLYHLSHSLVILAVVAFVTYLFLRRVPYELSGWLLHVLIDIPTHSYSFYPTPFLWPLAGVRVNGVAWSEPWFMVVNYLGIACAYYLLYRKTKSSRSQYPNSK